MLVSSIRPCRLLQRAAAVAATALLVAGCGLDSHSDGATGVAPDAATSDPALVHTAAGTVRGTVDPDLRFFGGIPYAAPPVGPLRFRPPAPALAWDGARDAAKPGARCIQDPKGDLEMGRNTSEDCLTLNVWTPPVQTSGARRPVLVWLHGGGFINGSSSIYNSTRLTTRGDIVVVTVNYRLGALGFLAHPALGAGPDVGNYGLADQQAALRWVRDNIAAFGGDPDKVTIAGESAGGMSVCDHLVAPASAGLFRGAIIASGPCQAQVALPEATRSSLAYAKAAGCGDAAAAADCLRQLPVDKLRKPVWYYGIGENTLSGPVTGTELLPVDPMQAISTGGAARVPVMIGTTRDEFTLFVALQYLRAGKRFHADGYPRLLESTFGADAAAVAQRYPLDRYGGSAAVAYSTAVTDGAFACVADRIGDALVADAPVYGYEFADPAPPTPDPLRQLPFPVGASHSLDLRYIFNMGGAPPPTPDQIALSDQMIGYWSSFVRDGRPGGEGAPEWPALAGDDHDSRMSLRPDGSRVITDYDQVHQCAFWAGLQH